MPGDGCSLTPTASSTRSSRGSGARTALVLEHLVGTRRDRITNLWLALPFDILMLVAGLASLPREPLEAARVDGASFLQTLRLIILPLLKPVIAIILVIRFADAFRIFDVVYVLTDGPLPTPPTCPQPAPTG